MIHFRDPPAPDPIDWNSTQSVFVAMCDRPPPHIIVEIVTFVGRRRERSYCRLSSPPLSELLPYQAWNLIGREIIAEAQEIELEMMQERD
jgi:hypothetical protein